MLSLKFPSVRSTEKHHYFYLIFLFSFYALLSSCSPPTYFGWKSQRANVYNSGTTDYGGIKGNSLFSQPLNANTENLIVDQSSILYYTLDDTKVQALNLANTASPAVKWTYSNPTDITTPLAMDDDYKVLFGDNTGKVSEVRDGVLQWSYTIPGVSIISILVNSGYVYVGTDRGAVYALNYLSNEKKVLWNFQATTANGVPKVLSLAMLPGNFVYALLDDDNIYAFNIVGNPSGIVSPTWTRNISGNVMGVPLCITNDFKTIFVASSLNGHGGESITAVDAVSGNVNWKTALINNGAFCTSSFVLNGVGGCLKAMCANSETLFIAGLQGLGTLSVKSGALAWVNNDLFDISFPLLAIDAQNLLYIANDETVFALDQKTKQVIWSHRTTLQNLNRSMIIGNHILYIGLRKLSTTDPNTLFAFN